MEENNKSVDGILENLALITDGIQTLFPEGKCICIFELKDDEFKKVLKNFRQIDQNFKKFSIDISGVEHVFIHETEAENNRNLKKEETPVKPQSRWKKILSGFKGS